MASPYVSRLVDAPLRSLFASLPALMLVGPRATGKTTTASQGAGLQTEFLCFLGRRT